MEEVYIPFFNNLNFNTGFAWLTQVYWANKEILQALGSYN